MSTATNANDKIVRLREAPVTINVSGMARGLLEMFDKQERVVLRFGMLPAKKMEILEKQLTEYFRETLFLGRSGNEHEVLFTEHGYRTINLKQVVREAMHEITLAIYQIGDLVV